MEPKEPLTVRRLMDYLQTFPPNAIIMRDDYSDPCIIEDPPVLKIGRLRKGSRSVSLKPQAEDYGPLAMANAMELFDRYLKRWDEDRESLSEDLPFVWLG